MYVLKNIVWDKTILMKSSIEISTESITWYTLLSYCVNTARSGRFWSDFYARMKVIDCKPITKI